MACSSPRRRLPTQRSDQRRWISHRPSTRFEYTNISKRRNSKGGADDNSDDNRPQFPDCPNPNSPHKDTTIPGLPQGPKKGTTLPDLSGDGGDGDGGDDDSISSESSDSSCSTCDTDQENCAIDNACGSFKLEDYKSLKIPPHSCHIATYRRFVQTFLAKLSVAGADKLLTNTKYVETA